MVFNDSRSFARSLWDSRGRFIINSKKHEREQEIEKKKKNSNEIDDEINKIRLIAIECDWYINSFNEIDLCVFHLAVIFQESARS